MTAVLKADVFQAIADPTRRQIMRLLAEKEQPIVELSRHFPISRTAVAKHLRILTEAELVRNRKQGREKVYTLHPTPLHELKEWIAYFDQFWDNKMAVLKHMVEEQADQ